MENLRYDAPNKDRFEEPDARQRFFSYGMLILFAAFFILVLVFLFPGRSLVKSLVNQAYFSQVDFRYSLLLLERNANLPVQFKEIEKNPGQVIERLLKARQLFLQNKEWDNLWLSYIVIKTMTYDEKNGKQLKNAGILAMQDYFRIFPKIPNSTTQLTVLAQDALALDLPPVALFFYEAVIEKDPNQGVYFYTKAAQAALWAGQCKKSADFYFSAQHQSTSMNDQRYLYIKALKTLFSCAEYNLALSLADKNINGLREDPQTYQLLTELSLKANQPQKAEVYVRKLLELQGKALGVEVPQSNLK